MMYYPVKNSVTLYDTQNGAVYMTDFYIADPYFVFRVTPHPDYEHGPNTADIVMRALSPRENFMRFGTDKEFQTWIVPQDYIAAINREDLSPLIRSARIEFGAHNAHFY